MAFKPRPAPIDPTDIAPLDQDPEFAKLATLRRALIDAKDARQRAIDMLAIESELRRPLSGSGKGPRAEMLRGRLEILRAETTTAEAPTADSTGLPPAVAQALRLTQGAQIDPAPDRDEHLKRLRDEHRMLHDGQMAVEQLLDDRRADLSLEVAKRLQPQHQAILRTIFETAAALSAAIEAERALFAAPLIAGYEGRPDVLARPALDGASRLGNLGEPESQIRLFRRRLETLGVL